MVRPGALELVVGVMAGIAGLLVAAGVLFQSTTNVSCVQRACTTTSRPAVTLTSVVNGGVALLGVSLAPLLVSGGAIWHGRTGGRICLWIGTAFTLLYATALLLFGNPLVRVLALVALALLTTILSFVGAQLPGAANP